MTIQSNSIFEYRIKYLLTQKQLAENAGVSQGTISCWETQTTQPRILMAHKICQRLGVELKDLFTTSNDQYGR